MKVPVDKTKDIPAILRFAEVCQRQLPWSTFAGNFPTDISEIQETADPLLETLTKNLAKCDSPASIWTANFDGNKLCSVHLHVVHGSCGEIFALYNAPVALQAGARSGYVSLACRCFDKLKFSVSIVCGANKAISLVFETLLSLSFHPTARFCTWSAFHLCSDSSRNKNTRRYSRRGRNVDFYFITMNAFPDTQRCLSRRGGVAKQKLRAGSE